MVGMDATKPREPQAALIARLAEIQGMKTGALRDEITRLTGSPAKSWNRPYLVRKVSWLVQEKARQESDGVGSLTLVPEVKDQPRSPRLHSPIQILTGRGVRDPRMPRTGAEIVKVYRGLQLRVRVCDAGFEWNDRPFKSLTAIAKCVTGQPFINGKLFFGVTKRNRGKGHTGRSTS